LISEAIFDGCLSLNFRQLKHLLLYRQKVIRICIYYYVGGTITEQILADCANQNGIGHENSNEAVVLTVPNVSFRSKSNFGGLS
jgi:hypothetical protein